MSVSTSDTFERACVFHSRRRQYFASIAAYSTHASPTYPTGFCELHFPWRQYFASIGANVTHPVTPGKGTEGKKIATAGRGTQSVQTPGRGERVQPGYPETPRSISPSPARIYYIILAVRYHPVTKVLTTAHLADGEETHIKLAGNVVQLIEPRIE
ncbi:hypothetical protein AVEN_198277-1 [Araneus ventricosus]|uniref:Uncharacterized protein n=1 Tax=Araneus ventricosus TaxID=182803 RepID=A0A4Y2WNC2_ARAVE|nr:hypothetical protein AVEN_198277-1 [Araneus ventricosus]